MKFFLVMYFHEPNIHAKFHQYPMYPVEVPFLRWGAPLRPSNIRRHLRTVETESTQIRKDDQESRRSETKHRNSENPRIDMETLEKKK